MILGLVAAASLAGCEVTGTATIRADDYVDLDLRAVVDGNELCYWQFGETVRTEERRLSRGSQRLCLLQGTVHKEELRRWGAPSYPNQTVPVPDWPSPPINPTMVVPG